MNKINLIGRGNVASHLYKAFAPEYEVKMVDSHTFINLDVNANLYIICVSDNAIQPVAQTLQSKLYECRKDDEKFIVVHTSGCTSLDSIRNLFHHTGVIYPLQTFSSKDSLNYGDIPVFTEASDIETEKFLNILISKVFKCSTVLNSESRKILHLSATLVSNFSNHIFRLADEKLREIGLDFSALLPLVTATVDKLNRMSPAEAQTGPAVRCDTSTIETHRSLLADNVEMLRIYDVMTYSILRNRAK